MPASTANDDIANMHIMPPLSPLCRQLANTLIESDMYAGLQPALLVGHHSLYSTITYSLGQYMYVNWLQNPVNKIGSTKISSCQ